MALLNLLRAQRRVDIDLVRVHHPDSVLCQDIPPQERRARFQAISAAYDQLRGKPVHRPHSHPTHHWSNYDYNAQFNEDLARRARARRSRGFSGTAHDPAQATADVGPALLPIMLIGGIVRPSKSFMPLQCKNS